MLHLRREPEFTGRCFHHHHEHAAVSHVAGGFHPERTDYRQESAGHCLWGGRCLVTHPWKQPEPAGRFVCQPYGNMGRFASLVRTVLLCVLHCTLQGFCQQIFAHHHHEVDVYLLFHLHDSLLCQRFDERRLERTEGGGNWQSDLYRGRCYLRQLHADCSGTKEPPPHGSRYVQLYPAACGLYRSRMLGNGFLQHDQNHCRGTYFRWSISGDFQP